MKYYVLLCVVFVFLVSCGNKDAIAPEIITETVTHDTDDPAIWIHPEDVSQSLIIGTDKGSNGFLYVFDLQGKIVYKTDTLQRPNNVDVAYNFPLNDSITTDIAVATERDRNMIRVFSLPDMQMIDDGGIPVFVGEAQRLPMGISLYTRKDSLGKNEIFAVVGRKDGPSGSYLHQYLLKSDTAGTVTGELVREFGNYSDTKEIEAIAVDNELGYIYYSDERAGIRKYYADPEKGNEELAIFGTTGFKEDREGISIFKADGGETGYILVSNQSNRSFKVFPREGTADNRHAHPEIVDIPVKANQSDGSDVMNVNFGEPFAAGIFIAMNDDKTFHYYDWRKFQEVIDKAQATK